MSLSRSSMSLSRSSVSLSSVIIAHTLDPVLVLAVVSALTFGLESDKPRFGVVAVAAGTDRVALEVVDVALAIVHVALAVVRVALEGTSAVSTRAYLRHVKSSHLRHVKNRA